MRVIPPTPTREKKFKRLLHVGMASALVSLGLGSFISGSQSLELASTCLIVAGAGFLALSPLFCLLYLMLFKLQATLMEFLLIMCCAANAFGFILQKVISEESSTLSRSPYLGVFIALVFVYMILGGAVWGLSAARRLGEKRPWRRVGLIVLGMGIYPAFAMVITGGAMALAMGLDNGPTETPVFLAAVFGFPMSLAWTVGFGVIESRCRQRVGEEVIF